MNNLHLVSIDISHPKDNAQCAFYITYEDLAFVRIMDTQERSFDICVWMDTSDTISQWRIPGDKALLVDYGFQDGITPIDMRSFTLIKQSDL
ncbi:MAG: hypothetical protein COC23_07100 [Hyphomicrobiales bacterium]|nr:MAG: hypothetical protein COC23_07100 [Hyphomicrobiales bacterium]